jgi:hypothetical protein
LFKFTIKKGSNYYEALLLIIVLILFSYCKKNKIIGTDKEVALNLEEKNG